MNAARSSYESLPLFAQYEAARQRWMKCHAEYASLCAFHPNKRRTRENMQAAYAKMRSLLAQLRHTPEHLAAFGWSYNYTSHTQTLGDEYDNH